MPTRTLTTSPALVPLYGRAVVTAAARRTGALPDTELVLADVAVDPDRLAAYDSVCGFRLGDVLPPTYPHVLCFPLQLQLMADRSFPFAMPGLVHVRNVVNQHRPVLLEDRLTLQVHAERLISHPKGAQVDLVAEVRVAGATVWSSRSTYLARGAKAAAGTLPPEPAEPPVTLPPDRSATVLRVAKDAGRRYAAVSGDVNPIHLNPLAAKAFGFPRAIAHGMWAKARCLAALEGRLPDAFTADVAFRKPILLPSTVELSSQRTDHGWDVALRSPGDGPTHLVLSLGVLRPG